MIIDFIVDEKPVCVIDIFEDLVPNTAAELRRQLPMKTRLQPRTKEGIRSYIKSNKKSSSNWK